MQTSNEMNQNLGPLFARLREAQRALDEKLLKTKSASASGLSSQRILSADSIIEAYIKSYLGFVPSLRKLYKGILLKLAMKHCLMIDELSISMLERNIISQRRVEEEKQNKAVLASALPSKILSAEDTNTNKAMLASVVPKVNSQEETKEGLEKEVIVDIPSERLSPDKGEAYDLFPIPRDYIRIPIITSNEEFELQAKILLGLQATIILPDVEGAPKACNNSAVLPFEWLTNRAKRVGGSTQYMFKGETFEPDNRYCWGIEEMDPPEITGKGRSAYMKWATAFGPTKRRVLTVPHLEWDNRKNYALCVSPKIKSLNYKIYDMAEKKIIWQMHYAINYMQIQHSLWFFVMPRSNAEGKLIQQQFLAIDAAFYDLEDLIAVSQLSKLNNAAIKTNKMAQKMFLCYLRSIVLVLNRNLLTEVAYQRLSFDDVTAQICGGRESLSVYDALGPHLNELVSRKNEEKLAAFLLRAIKNVDDLEDPMDISISSNFNFYAELEHPRFSFIDLLALMKKAGSTIAAHNTISNSVSSSLTSTSIPNIATTQSQPLISDPESKQRKELLQQSLAQPVLFSAGTTQSSRAQAAGADYLAAREALSSLSLSTTVVVDKTQDKNKRLK